MPCPLLSTVATTMPHRAIIEPIERSMPPEMSSMAMAMVNTPRTEICVKMATMLFSRTKRGLMMETTRTSSAMTNASSTR